MKKLSFYCLAVFIIKVTFLNDALSAQDISLPAPNKTGGRPLMEALNERQSTRTFTKDNLTRQQLSDLLWAAWGINRADVKKRTAPSANNTQEIDAYVSLPEGLYIYDAESNILKQIHNRDIRKLCGTQDFVGEAPVNLVYVSDMGKRGKKPGDIITDSDLLTSYAGAGFIAQNVYLYCASENLGCVIRAMIDKEKLAPEMGLISNQKIILSQTIGIPKK